jgi:hypothetical protein
MDQFNECDMSAGCLNEPRFHVVDDHAEVLEEDDVIASYPTLEEALQGRVEAARMFRGKGAFLGITETGKNGYVRVPASLEDIL